MKKCKYCNKKNIQNDFCDGHCKKKAEAYFNYWKKYKYLYSFILGICLLSIIIQLTLFADYIIVSKIMIIILGIVFFVFPFGNTIDEIGIKNTVWIVRISATILMIIGIIFITYD